MYIFVTYTYIAMKNKIHLNKELTLLFLLTLLTNICIANNLRRIVNSENLSNNSIESLHQDQSGKLWIGTCDGLNVYNGRSISVYQPSDKSLAISGNIIDNIIETEEDVLWVQTYHGLNKLNRKQNTLKYYNEFKPNLFWAKDKRNTLFIIQDDNFIQYFDDKLELFKTLPFVGLSLKGLLNFTIDKDNKLWLFYSSGKIVSYHINYSEGTITFQERLESTHQHKLLHCFHSSNDIIIIDSEYNIYIYNLHNAAKSYHYNVEKLVKEAGEISSMVYSSEKLFIAFKTNGLRVLSKLKESNDYESAIIPIDCGVFTLKKDKFQDIVWIGTDGQGVYSYSNDMYTVRSTKLKDYLTQVGRPIRSIYKDKENSLWIGSKGDGIIKISDYKSTSNLNESKIERLNVKNSKLIDNSVYCTKESKKGILWIGTEYGLNYYSYKDRLVKKVNIVGDDKSIIYIHDILEQDSTLWLATVGMGIVKARLKWVNNTPQLDNIEIIRINNEDMGSNYFFSIYAESDSIIWFANRGFGAFKVETKTKAYERITFSDKKNNKALDEVFSINKSGNHMYFGTSAGLIEYYGENDYRVLDNNFGLLNNTIHSIVKDQSDESLWLSTNRGIINYNPQGNSLRNYGLNDGLDIIEFSDGAAYIDNDTGIIYLGGVNGYISITKNRSYTNEYMPNLSLDELSIYGKWENINDYLFEDKNNIGIKLSNTENFISLSLNAIDFLNANNYTFLYKIEGTNDQWIDNGNSNIISLTNLRHGDYKLYVKYINRIVEKESPEFIITISILPPWYQSKIAYIIYNLLIISAFILLIKYIQFRNEKKRKRLIRKLEAEHKDKMYESKLGFFTSIAHEFCTPLTLIYGPCNQILELENSSRTKKYAQVILRNAERLNSLIQDLIEFRKIETDNKPPIIEEVDISSIINNITLSFKEFADTNNAKFYKTIPYEMKWNSDRSYITTIVTNLVSNAFKYMSENGSVEVEVKEEKGNLVIRVSNTGKGIKARNLDKIFDRHLILDDLENNDSKKLWSRNGLGLAISDNMVKNLNGTIEIKSFENEWTHFMVTLPMLEKNIEIRDSNISPNSPSILLLGKTKITDIQSKIEIDNTKKTILVIDDEIDILWFITDIFSEQYNVIPLVSSAEVEPTLKKIHPDLILCDINMPLIDGIELTSLIKADKHTAHIPLIIISARQGVEEQIKGLNAGAELYITKPFNVEFLKTSVERMMNRKSVLKEYFTSSRSAYELNDGQFVHGEDNQLLRTIQQLVDDNITNSDLNADFIAKEMNLSTRNLYRKLVKTNSKNISDIIRDSRLHRSEILLLQTKKTIDEVINESGFTNRVSFYKAFSKKNNCTPTEYRENNLSDL